MLNWIRKILPLICLWPGAILAQAEAPVTEEQGQETGERDTKLLLNEDNANISRRQASELAQEHYDGRVLNIRLEENKWHMRIDNNGTLLNVFVDAESGEVTGPEQ